MKIDRPHNQQHYSEPMPRLGKKKKTQTKKHHGCIGSGWGHWWFRWPVK
jgi:hypothetical protein